ncbi:hypothetical protein DPMN_188254 [Dreissena polymorpha]|uniref:Uncharacterized protein n=1 Tax=Dreissena polymorpha TaxID=45954 RepID=A0A9D4DQG9_DREPO|nr:hypothetical protein DPMN_188254 [Dreissena polymorpha]
MSFHRCRGTAVYGSITNSPYDYLNYKPTLDHVFLDEPTLAAFERYVDLMFSVADERLICATSNIENIRTRTFRNSNRAHKKGRYMQSIHVKHRLPIWHNTSVGVCTESRSLAKSIR